MASFSKRRKRDGSISWDALVRIVGYPASCRSFRTKLEAELWAGQIEAAAKGRTLVLSRKMTLANLIAAARAKLKDPDSAALRYWREQIGMLRLIDVNSTLIARHRDLLRGAQCRSHGHKRMKPRSDATVRKYLIALSCVYRIGMRELRVCNSNPVAMVSKPSEGEWRKRFLSDDERAALIAECKRSTSNDLLLAVLLSLTTGLRQGELYRMRWGDVDLARRWVVLPQTKNGSSRGVPLTESVAKLLAERRGLPDEVVFAVDLTKAWKNALTRAKISNFRWHDLRHTTGSTLVQNGANLSEVAELLGHKSIKMTSRYSHVHSDHTKRLVDRIMGELA
jgi:integrase